MRKLLLTALLFAGIGAHRASAGAAAPEIAVSAAWFQDTIPATDSASPDIRINIEGYIGSVGTELASKGDSVPLLLQKKMPLITVPQYVKGAAAGLYIQENTGEPGTTRQFMYLRGLARPVLSIKDMYDVQPAVYVNGIPLIQDNPFIYNIQTYTVNPAGPANNLLSTLSLDNIDQIRVVKDYRDAALLGPFASNGAVYITTKAAAAGENRVSVNSYMGYVQTPGITTINAEYEKNFRLPFYYKYGTAADFESMPAYLSDSSNASYYGPSNWTDRYYKNTPQYSVNASLTGGSERANFRFFGDYTRSVAGADDTKFDRYSGSFYINMMPTRWLTISSMINGSILDRDRNKSFVDRFAEMQFLPNSKNPLAPNLNNYNAFLDFYDNTIDDNATTSIQGFWDMNARLLKDLNYDARVAFDYNEGRRNIFWNSALFDGSNYASNYFGFNQRLVIENTLNFKRELKNGDVLKLKGGISYTGDIQRYNYGIGYNGPNDYIKVNVVKGNKKEPGTYLISKGFDVYSFTDKMQQRLMSFYGKADYSFSDQLDLGALVRSDGSSAMQPGNRWFISYAFDGTYHLAPKINSALFSRLDVFASWGRIGDLRTDQNIGAGPQYLSQLGWASYPTLGSYNSFGTYSRPYNYGWIGYDIPWAYSSQLNAGTEFAVLKDQIALRLEWYSKDNRNVVFPSPVTAESGYIYEWKPGMEVNNTGLDLTISSRLGNKNGHGLSWNGQLNVGFNKNKLKALPDGLSSVITDGRKLEVGKAVDQFWLLQNNGIYNTDSEVPVDPATNLPMTYRGIALKAGDPKWMDVNGDYTIDDKDRILMGNYLPRISGGFVNQFAYKKFDLSFQLVFALKKQAMNQVAAGYYGFIERDNANTLESVKEITYWEKTVEPDAYERYNPWSQVRPYQVDQSIFMESASFLKLRTVSLGYQVSNKVLANKIRKIYLYITGTNLLTFTNYSGKDPELIEYNGYDTGYGMRLPKSFILGVKVDL
ncbi:TonB-dependent receptor plug domain-containing protein [Niabella beijingensis]|uniref:TonB-dependent receptor plug domain-containing protein n=1 Tax=Niabella beijingensis TaxID=2872700 RepID=UPI001CBE0CF0|nr:TonB-dependent receptor plug domain-containing protein [Niabella beijingensis]MBZ4188310.1 TonB-dependent receptor plug domain-containing protein [Niabella beijingensis]